MSRFVLSILAAAGVVALSACSTSSFEPMAVTRDASTVASCQKLGDLQAVQGRYDDTELAAQLERKAREMGANTVLISDAEGRTGVAYQCGAMPAVASPSGSSN